MNNRLAIVGSHEITRGLAPFNDPECDIWVFNEAYSQTPYNKDTGKRERWCKRATAVFQLHPPVVYRSPFNRSDRNHWQWLQQRHNGLQIYMQDVDLQVPNSIKYPLREIELGLMSDVQIVERDGSRRPVKVLTSTIVQAIALAILKGQYSTIEIYGIEMSSNTEYYYQREAVMFWVGYAAGRGIKVDLHSAHELFDRFIYAYEGNIDREPEEFAARIDDLQEIRKEAYERLTDAEFTMGHAYESGRIIPHIEKLGEASTDLGKIDGQIQTLQKYHDKAMDMWRDSGTALIDRQEFEGSLAQAQKDAEVAGQKVYIQQGRMDVIYSSYSQDKDPSMLPVLKKSVTAYSAACYDSGVCMGTIDENMRLMFDYEDKLKSIGGYRAVEAIRMNQTANQAG